MSLDKNDKFETGLKFFNTLQSRLCFLINGLNIHSLIIVVYEIFMALFLKSVLNSFFASYVQKYNVINSYKPVKYELFPANAGMSITENHGNSYWVRHTELPIL